jgi:PAS domain S-box-containing protein
MGVAGSMRLLGFLALAVSVPAALVLGWLLRGQWLPQQAPALAHGPHSPEPEVSLLDSLPDAMTISRNGIRLYANAAAARLLGVPSAADLIGQSVFDWVNPEELAAFSTEPQLFDDVEVVGQMIPLRCFKRDGTPFLAEIRRLPISYRGEPAVLSVTRDVTVSKAAELQLRQLALAVEQNPHSVVITDTLGRVDYANEAFLAASGYGLSQVLGQSMSLLSSGKTPTETYRALWAAPARRAGDPFCRGAARRHRATLAGRRAAPAPRPPRRPGGAAHGRTRHRPHAGRAGQPGQIALSRGCQP